MNDLINEMNRILQQWKEKYDFLGLTHDNFTVGQDNTLYLNDIPVPDFRVLPLESATFDAEHVLYYFSGSHTLHITITWPEEGVPTVFFGFL